MASELDGGGRRGRGNGRRRRFRAPRLDSSGKEVEGVAAELFRRFDLLGEVSNGGDATATASAPWRPVRGARVREREQRGGE